MPGPRNTVLRAGGSAPPAGLDPGLASRRLQDADPVLGALIRKVGPCTLQPEASGTVFAALARSIVYQQLTGKAAATIHGRVQALFPRARVLTAEGISSAGDEELRAAGLSRSKVAALRDLSAKVLAREIPTMRGLSRLEDEQVIEALTQVRGVGRWTVEMLLMFRLGRPDVLPCGDYGVRKGYAAAWELDELPSPAELAKQGERWAPFRTVAAWYLWRAADGVIRKKQPSRAS